MKRLNLLRGRTSGPAEGPGAGPGEGRPADASAGVFQTLRETPLSAHVVLIGIFINQVAAFVQIYLVLFLHARGFSYEQGGFALGCFSVGAIAGTFGGGRYRTGSGRAGRSWCPWERPACSPMR